MINGLTSILAIGTYGAATAFRDGVHKQRTRDAQIEAVRKNRREVAAVKSLGAQLREARQQIEIERRRTAEAQAQAGRLAARVMALEAAARRA